MTAQLDSFKSGQSIRCTLTKAPRNAGARKTLERLMRLQPSVVRGLRNSHRKRQQNLVVYNRGNRDWTKREVAAAFCALLAFVAQRHQDRVGNFQHAENPCSTLFDLAVRAFCVAKLSAFAPGFGATVYFVKPTLN